MTTAKRKTARKPARKTHRRKRATMHAAPARRRSTSYSRRRKGFLSEIINPAQATEIGKAMVMGAAGAGAVHVAFKLIPATAPAYAKPLAGAVLAFLGGSVLKSTAFAAGAAGRTVVEIISGAGMSENSYVPYSDFAQLPAVLNENGFQNLQEKQANYLQEMNLQENRDYFVF